MFRSCLIAAVLALPVAAAPAHRGAKPAGTAKKECAMCAAMKAAKGKTGAAIGPGTAGGMGGMMGGKAAAPGSAVSITFAPDGTMYAIRGDTIYKLDANLAIAAEVRLGGAPVPGTAGTGEHAGHKH